MPPLLHRQAEAGGLGWPHRPLRAPLRPSQVRDRRSRQRVLSLSPDRRAALVAARAAAIVRAHFDVDIPAASWSDHGSGGVAASRDGHAWIAPADDKPVALGAALAWALRQGAEIVDLLAVAADDAAQAALAAVARRAQAFATPPSVWRIDGTTLHAVVPAPVEPVRVAAPVTAEQVLILEQAGVDVVVEGGEVIGELRGLEVARVVVDADGQAAHLEVGVGRFDREAFALIHGELPSPLALAQVVVDVGVQRRSDAEPHPINRLARERWLRHQLVAAPALVGATRLEPVEGARPRGGLRDPGIAVAAGERPDGTPLVVATSVGIDLEAVPDAADARLRHAPDADLVIVVPPGDDHAITHDLAAMLASPATVTTLAGEWPR